MIHIRDGYVRFDDDTHTDILGHFFCAVAEAHTHLTAAKIVPGRMRRGTPVSAVAAMRLRPADCRSCALLVLPRYIGTRL